MRTGGLFQFMRFVCNLPRIMRLFDFGRNYAKNNASIIRQGLLKVLEAVCIRIHKPVLCKQKEHVVALKLYS